MHSFPSATGILKSSSSSSGGGGGAGVEDLSTTAFEGARALLRPPPIEKVSLPSLSRDTEVTLEEDCAGAPDAAPAALEPGAASVEWASVSVQP
jgi:hypothetical protein